MRWRRCSAGGGIFDSALKLASIPNPDVACRIFLVLPDYDFLTLTGIYGAYIVMTGLPRLMKSPEQNRRPTPRSSSFARSC